ncbi:MAG: LytTR family DNA-binding domain-containing protein [Erythrobacter sp.]|uniref:LytTR family DNA-binding domain-containing protein n=1 Tax=Erythrobacter sp. TaxID=1042 RepID=UPI0032664180
MHAAIASYNSNALHLRLIVAIGAVVALSAAYCLAYTYSAGRPATLSDAFSWGAINLAPWVAVIEIGREIRRARNIFFLVVGAFSISLLLGAVYDGELPNSLEVVRRLPGAVFSVACLIGLSLWQGRRAHQTASISGEAATNKCEWIRAAGNYVEIKYQGSRPVLKRSSLAHFVESSGSELVRIHRSFAVAPEVVEVCERHHVRLTDGKRLPIGNAYRSALDNL